MRTFPKANKMLFVKNKVTIIHFRNFITSNTFWYIYLFILSRNFAIESASGCTLPIPCYITRHAVEEGGRRRRVVWKAGGGR
jgi:hypothetical protein